MAPLRQLAGGVAPERLVVLFLGTHQSPSRGGHFARHSAAAAIISSLMW